MGLIQKAYASTRNYLVSLIIAYNMSKQFRHIVLSASQHMCQLPIPQLPANYMRSSKRYGTLALESFS